MLVIRSSGCVVMKFFVGPNVSINDFISILEDGSGGEGGGGACGFNLKFWHFDGVNDGVDGCFGEVVVSLFLSILVALFSSFFTFAPPTMLLILLGTMALSLTVVVVVALLILIFDAIKFWNINITYFIQSCI